MRWKWVSDAVEASGSSCAFQREMARRLEMMAMMQFLVDVTMLSRQMEEGLFWRQLLAGLRVDLAFAVVS